MGRLRIDIELGERERGGKGDWEEEEGGGGVYSNLLESPSRHDS